VLPFRSTTVSTKSASYPDLLAWATAAEGQPLTGQDPFLGAHLLPNTYAERLAVQRRAAVCGRPSAATALWQGAVLVSTSYRASGAQGCQSASTKGSQLRTKVPGVAGQPSVAPIERIFDAFPQKAGVSFPSRAPTNAP
jgi:hypothetical protein